MKTIFRVFSVLFVLGLITVYGSMSANAQSASGNYQFTFNDDILKTVQFDCRATNPGATGQLVLTDQATIVYIDVDGDGSPEEKYAGVSVTVAFDDMSVVKNQAVMSGVVRESNIPYLVGQRMLLTVEDNGQDPRQPDRLTWGVYKPIERNWIPSDAELKEDPGVGLRWWATDAERRDDVGYEMPIADATGKISAFPISAYLFVDTSDGVGDIVVQP